MMKKLIHSSEGTVRKTHRMTDGHTDIIVCVGGG